jgi:hypothetical protein
MTRWTGCLLRYAPTCECAEGGVGPQGAENYVNVVF